MATGRVMNERVRIGVVGAGLVAQWEHIPNLLRLSDRFQLVGVSDPSRVAREFVGNQFGVASYESSDALIEQRLDAILIASPDHTHVSETLKAIGAGLHVFCETPLCYGPSQATAVIAARDAAGTVVQVGYMKRHDPAYKACLDVIAEGSAPLSLVSVEVSDPGHWPFAAAHPCALVDDLPKSLIAAGHAARSGQIGRALGFKPGRRVADAFAQSLCSSLVHDINVCAGLLEQLGVPVGDIVGGAFFADGKGSMGTIRLGEQAMWHLVHLKVPEIANYRERISFYFNDRIVELLFPSPYLDHLPTRLTVSRSKQMRHDVHEIRADYGEAFVIELCAFWSSIVCRTPVTNTVEQARSDQMLLCDLARHIAGKQHAPARAATDGRRDFSVPGMRLSEATVDP